MSVVRSGVVSRPVNVTYSTSDGSAQAGQDYAAQSGTLTFGPGETVKNISIPVSDDTVPEADETINLTLSNPTGGATFGLTSATLIIQGNDNFVEFSSAGFSATEFSGYAYITIVRTPSVNFSAVVNYATSDGTAKAGLDYAAQSGSLYFDPGVTNASFAVQLFEQTSAEGAKTLNLALSNPVNTALGAQTTAVLTITNSASGVEFTGSEYRVDEDGGAASIMVRRRGATNVAFTVDYATTTQGTAKVAADYLPQSGTLAFKPGQTNQTFTVPIIDNPLVDGDRTVILALSNPSRGTLLAGQSTVRLTILDNEKPSLVVDPGFKPVALAKYSQSPESAFWVQTLAVQDDGKVLIGGYFSLADGSEFPAGIARLESDGSLDRGFAPRAVASVTSIAVQADGKVLVAGPLILLDAVNHPQPFLLSRLNPDGSWDSSFAPRLNMGNVFAVVAQPDGKVVLSGYGSQTNFSSDLRRLNADGTADTGFAGNVASAGGSIAIALQSDRKIVIGGTFTTVNGVPRSGIARLNANGSLDDSFNPGQGVRGDGPPGQSGAVSSLVVQPDGKIAIGGYFTFVDGISRKMIARLNADGSLDPTFDPGTGMDRQVLALAVLANGELLVGGTFLSANGFPRMGLAKLHADGSLDTTFNPNLRVLSEDSPVASVYALAVVGNESALVGGHFDSVDGQRHPGIARVFLDPNQPMLNFPVPNSSVYEAEAPVTLSVQRLGETSGALTVDYATVGGSATAGLDFPSQSGTLSFAPLETTKTIVIPILDDGLVENDEAFKVVLRNPSGGALLGEPSVSEITIQDDERPGSLDFSFRPETDFTGLESGQAFFPGGYPFSSIVALADGKALLISPSICGLVRLNADGTVDKASALRVNGCVESAVLLPDSRIVIGGSFAQVNGVNRVNVARLNPDGSLDDAFDPITSSDGDVSAMAADSDGGLFVGGIFTQLNGRVRNRLARLNADGTLDDRFNPDPQLGCNGEFLTISVQADHKLLVSGSFFSPSGECLGGVRRFNSDGTLDTTFNTIVSAPGAIQATVSAQPDGKALVAGGFVSVNGISRPGIARLNADGSLDTGFDVEVPFRVVCSWGCSVEATVRTAALEPNGKVLIGGDFTEVNGVRRSGIARLNADGSLDTSFDAGAGVSYQEPNNPSSPSPGQVFAIGLQPDGGVLIGGRFTSVNRVPRPGLARLNGDGNIPFASVDFAFPDSSIGEGSGTATVAVRRIGNTNATLSVDYYTSNGTAMAGVDYVTQSGRLSFASSETAKTITIPILSGGLAGNDRTLALTLTNPTGVAALGAQATTSLKILDGQRPGSLDLSFDAGDGPSSIPVPGIGGSFLTRLNAIAVQPDGKVVVGGQFDYWNGLGRWGITRLNLDGSLDPDYNPGTNIFSVAGSVPVLTSLALQPDSRVWIVEQNVGGLRLDLDGSVDASSIGFFGSDSLFAARNDGKMLVAFRNSSQIFQLNADGSSNKTFNITGPFDMLSALASQADGKILALVRSGDASTIVRLKSDGTSDGNFPIAAQGAVSALAVQADGRILIGGSFTNIAGVSRNAIARLNADGSPDTAFDPGTGVTGRGPAISDTVNAVAVQPDGDILIAGSFTAVNGTRRNGLARLHGDPPLRFVPTGWLRNGAFQLTLATQPGKTYFLQSSIDLLNWSPLSTNIASGFALEFQDPNAASVGQRFYRAILIAP